MTSRTRQRTIDLIMVAVIVLLVALGTSHIEQEGSARAVDAGAYLLGFGGAFAVLLWRRLPIAMVAVVGTCLCAYLAIGYPPGPSLLPGPVSLVLLGLRVRRGVAWAGAAGMAIAVMLGQIIGDGDNDHLAIAAAGWSIAAVLAGQLGAARIERRRLSERQAITDERLRIAQDLHDSVAHAMATINVQAGTASHLLARQPDKVDHAQLRGALDAIRGASSEVLDELGAILGLLRRDGSAERQPQHGIERVDELVARARADGLDVSLQLQPSSLSGPAGQAAFRVVQEALSNVRQHAGRSASVRVVVAGTAVSVIDDGGMARSAVAAGSGLGLVGMRERVEASGGTLVAEAAGAGFRVIASWP